MTSPTVLIIDDHADAERAKFITSKSTVAFEFRHPEDITSNDLENANVVVVDFKLDDDWQKRDSLNEIALKPMNGLALIAVLQSHERQLEGSPTAFVLRSAHLTELMPDFVADSRLHVIARQFGLDWVLTKNEDIGRQAAQILSLADATNSLPEDWPSDNPKELIRLLQNWLSLPDAPWRELAWQDIEDCHPPIHELTRRKHGLRLVRWMTQSILPYPCFLLTIDRLATRLRVTRKSLDQGINNGLKKAFESAAYVGSFALFDGKKRWWRSGLESVLWELTDGRSFDSDRTRQLLNEHCNGALEVCPHRQPVLCLDREFLFLGEASELADAVRIQPDDWPVYADQAWALVADANNEPRLAAATIAADREKLQLDQIQEESR